MKKRYSNFIGICMLAGIALTAGNVQANDEFRAGAILQIPFSIGGESIFDVANIRLGAMIQYAEVEETEVIITGPTRHEDEGDEVYGAEFNAFVQPFGGWNASFELLGFYGSNDVQGAVGAGYDMGDGLYGTVKAMFPYSEIGLRFIGPVALYVGVRTLGEFDPDENVTYELMPFILPSTWGTSGSSGSGYVVTWTDTVITPSPSDDPPSSGSTEWD